MTATPSTVTKRFSIAWISHSPDGNSRAFGLRVGRSGMPSVVQHPAKLSSLKASPGTDWSKRFYQYANRLAHAWFLADVNGLPVRLVFLHFIGDVDMDGPSTRREWEAALTVLHEALGFRGRVPRYVAEIFIDVRPAVPAVA